MIYKINSRILFGPVNSNFHFEDYVIFYTVRDRPFNLQGEVMVFFVVQDFFSDNTRVRIF